MKIQRRIRQWQGITAVTALVAIVAALGPAGVTPDRDSEHATTELLAGIVTGSDESARSFRQRLEYALDDWRLLPVAMQEKRVLFLATELESLLAQQAVANRQRLREIARECLLWPLEGKTGQQVRELATQSIQRIAASSP